MFKGYKMLISGICLQPSVFCHLSSVICLPSSVFCHLSSAICLLFRSYNQIPRGPDGQLAEDAIGLPEARDLSLSFRAWFTEPFSRRNMGLPD